MLQCLTENRRKVGSHCMLNVNHISDHLLVNLLTWFYDGSDNDGVGGVMKTVC